MTQEFEDRGIHFVKFGAEWCQPCRALEPSLNKFEEEYISKVKVHRVDIDEAFDMASKYNIRNIPTIIIFKDGEPIDRLHGVQSLQNLKTKLEYVESN
jgi:thioredoxin 1